MNQISHNNSIETLDWKIHPQIILQTYYSSKTESIEHFFSKRLDLSQNAMAVIFFLRCAYVGSNKTVQDYTLILCNFLNTHKEHINGPDFFKITPGQIEKYIETKANKGQKLSTLLKHLSVIKSFYNTLYDLGKINSNGSRFLKRRLTILNRRLVKQHQGKLTGHIKKSLSFEQIDTLLSVMKKGAPIRDYCLIRFLYSTGARASEVVSLTWGDFLYLDDDGWFVEFIGKGGKERRVHVAETMIEDLMTLRRLVFDVAPYVDASGISFFPVFCKIKKNNEPRKHSHLGYDGIYNVVRKWGRKILGDNMPFSPHVLRHTHATHLVALGASLDSIRFEMGHSNVQTTELYNHNRYYGDRLGELLESKS